MWNALDRFYSGLRWLIPVLAGFGVALIWAIDTVRYNYFQLQVPTIYLFPWLESKWTYFYLHLITFLPVFGLSFDRRVHYYRKWKHLLPAILITAAGFIAWDVYFTHRGVWGFNSRYLSGYYLAELPLEEWLFFFTVPFACVFIYECLDSYLGSEWLDEIEPWITRILIVVFLLTSLFYWNHMYTGTTFLLAGFALWYHTLVFKTRYRSKFYFAYAVSWIPFLAINGVLTGGFTTQPIVMYNPREFLGIRVGSVPLDDAGYSFLLLLCTIALYEYFRRKKKSRSI